MSSTAKFGFFSLILYAINSIVGSGIFLLPQRAFLLSGPASLLVIVFIAFLVMCMTCCFAEAAGRFRENGGAFVYAREAFGSFVGFEVGFMRYVVSITSWSTLAVAFVTLLSVLFPVLADFLVIKLLSALVVVLYGWINYRGVRVSEWVNNASTICKLLPLTLFIIVGLFFIKADHFSPLVPADFTEDTFAAAVILLFYAFGGFESIPVAAEDIRDPEKNMPRGMLLGVGIVALVYFLILGVTIGLLGSQTANTEAPVAEAARVALGNAGFLLISIASLLSILGINLAASFAAPRSLVALANHNMVSASLLQHNRYGVQGRAIIATTVLALLVAISGTFAELAMLSVVARFAQYLPTCIAVLVFRHRMGRSPSFTIPGGPSIPVLAIVIGLWLIWHAPFSNLVFGLGGLVAGALLYLLSVKSMRETLSGTQQ
ncbi:APC family permease [Spongorhabdus nitratireducens]